jgi:uncharacterized protein with HEPN domain
VSHKHLLYVLDLLEAIRKIRAYTLGVDETAFLSNEMILDACYHNFLVIGEAVKQFPENLRNQHGHIPWKSIAGLRDLVAHEYFRVDNRILWDVIQNHLAPLETAANSLYQTLSSEISNTEVD